MARTIDAPAPEICSTPETAHLDRRRHAESLAAQVVATLGTKRNIDAFIDDEDFTEVAPAVADAILDAEDAARLCDPSVSQMILEKLTHEEWSLYDSEISAKNWYALASLEAGILIGVELERVRARANGVR